MNEEETSYYMFVGHVLKMHSNIHYVQTSAICFYLYKIPRIIKFIESESTLVDARGQGWG